MTNIFRKILLRIAVLSVITCCMSCNDNRTSNKVFYDDADIPINRDTITSKLTYFEKVVEETIVHFERGEAQPYDPKSRSIWAELASLEDVMSNMQTDIMAKTTLKLATEAKKHAEAGNARAQYTLGRCYLYGYGVDKDPGQAIPWLCKAAEQDDLMAQNAIGGCCMNGEGVEKDPEMAVKWFRMAAEQNLADAQCRLGYCYLNGQGVEKNPEQTIKWLRKAADQNLADAQVNLGLCYLNGQGVEKDPGQAAKWFRMAADQNLAFAQNILGYCYFSGEGLNKDPEQAVKYFRMAADQNFADAQNNLAYRYLNGEGVEKDAEQAVKWLRMAAKQNVKEAQYGLGLCYDKGDGVPQNTAETEKWYSKAAKAGHTEAQARLKVLKMPVVAYEPSKHGPRIKGFFIGMSVRQFDEVAAKILNEVGMVYERKEEQAENLKLTYTHKLDDHVIEGGLTDLAGALYYGSTYLTGNFNNNGEMVELFMPSSFNKIVFNCKDIDDEEFTSRISNAYKINFNVKKAGGPMDRFSEEVRYVNYCITPQGVIVENFHFMIILKKTTSKTEIDEIFD